MGQLETMLLRELNWFSKLAGAAGSIVLTELTPDGRLTIACGNLGDCEVCLALPDGRIEMLSELHRISNDAERRRILDLGGVIVNGSRVAHLVKVWGIALVFLFILLCSL